MLLLLLLLLPLLLLLVLLTVLLLMLLYHNSCHISVLGSGDGRVMRASKSSVFLLRALLGRAGVGKGRDLTF